MTSTGSKALIQKLEALSKISKAISSDLYLEDILRLMVVVTAEVMKSKICSLWLVDERDKALKIRATQSMSEEYLKERNRGVDHGGQPGGHRHRECRPHHEGQDYRR